LYFQYKIQNNKPESRRGNSSSWPLSRIIHTKDEAVTLNKTLNDIKPGTSTNNLT